MESDSDYVKLAKQGGQKGRTTRDVAALFIYVRYIFPGGPSLFGVLYLLIPKGLLWHEETLASKPSQYTPSNWFGDSEEPADDNGNIR